MTVTDARGRQLRGTGLDRWLTSAAPRAAAGHLSIALVSDRTMRELNRRYRAADYATDVLSFPAGSTPNRGGRAGRVSPTTPDEWLGDIVIATGVAARQAREFGHPRAVELRILALHGLLHLLGYDHEADDGEMRRVEDRLRRRAKLPVGLTARGFRTAPRQ